MLNIKARDAADTIF